MGITNSESFEIPEGRSGVVLGALRRELTPLLADVEIQQKIRIDRLKFWIARYRSLRLIVAQTGVGPVRATEAARRTLSSFSVKFFISVGFACSLKPQIGIGDVILGERFFYLDIDPQNEYLADQGLLHIAEQSCGQSFSPGGPAIPGENTRVFKGSILTVHRMIDTAVEKREIAGRTDAIALDMESAAIAEVAANAKIPYLSVRVISDVLDENLQGAAKFISASGDFQFLKGFWALLGHPARFAHLYRLRSDTRIAANQLTRFFQGFLPKLD